MEKSDTQTDREKEREIEREKKTSGKKNIIDSEIVRIICVHLMLL